MRNTEPEIERLRLAVQLGDLETVSRILDAIIALDRSVPDTGGDGAGGAAPQRLYTWGDELPDVDTDLAVATVLTDDDGKVVDWGEYKPVPQSQLARWSVLHDAAIRNNVAVAGMLLDHGMDANNQSRDDWCFSWSALHVAARHGHAEMVTALLDGGANPSLATHGGFTPLHYAAESGHAEVIARLLGGGADPKARTADMFTAIHLAAQYANDPGILAALAAAGGTPDGRNRTNGKTAMHYAAQRGSTAHVVMLLRLGAHIPCNDARLVPPAVPEQIRAMLDAAGNFWSLAAHRTTALGAVCFDTLSTVILSANCAHRAQGEMATVLPPEMWELVFSYGRVLEWDGRQRPASIAAAQDLFD